MDHGDMGMVDDAAMEELRELEGDPFDLAEAVVAAQEAKIEQMRRWLDEWDLD